ncbi:MAG: alpha-amylase family glycosyl hydrolase [Acidobacteriota bacterium]
MFGILTAMSRLETQLGAALLAATCLVALACGRAPATPPSPATVSEAAPAPWIAADARGASLGAERPWWQDAVVYEVFVRSFADARSGPWAHDGIGDLDGLLAHLDYLNDGDPETDDDLEVDALWLMPIFDSPSYHGYDVVDYRAIEPDYGDLATFQRLVEACHRRGIRIILDLVLNHTSSEHPWFRGAWRRGSATRDWYLFATTPQGFGGPWGQQVWHPLPWWQRGLRHLSYHKYYGIFWRGMPDLNHRNPAVEAALHDVARFWVEQGADGYRLDAVRHLIEDGAVQEDTPGTHAWLQRFGRMLDALDPRVVTVGEVWDDTEIVASYGADELDLLFQFELADAILDAVDDGVAIEADGGGLRTVADAVAEAFPDSRAATFLSNHDQVRVMSRLDGDVQGARLAATLLFTLPGTPFVYYGEELGLRGRKPDPKIRTPMPWDDSHHAGFSSRRPWIALRPEADTIHVAAQSDDPRSLLAAYRRLIRLRHRIPALRRGTFESLAPSADDPPALFAFRRNAPTAADADVLVALNLGAAPLDIAPLVHAQAGPARPVEALLEVGPDGTLSTPRDPVAALAPRSARLLRLVAPAPQPSPGTSAGTNLPAAPSLGSAL